MCVGHDIAFRFFYSNANITKVQEKSGGPAACIHHAVRIKV